MPSYRALTGLTYPPDRVVEPGQVVDDIPPQSVKWLLASGHIEEAGGKPVPVPASSEDAR